MIIFVTIKMIHCFKHKWLS